jgi:DNA polymerase III delta subunit
MKNNNSKNENFKNAICYIPFVAIVLFFTENNKTTELKKHIKY